MKVNEILIELMVNDVEKTVRFYQHILGFKMIASEDEDGKMYWAKIALDHFRISLKDYERIQQESKFMGQAIGGTFSLVFQVPELEKYYEDVANQCRLLNHPHITPCGATQFSMQDNNGYILTFERFN